jgi:ABC transporter substrate binding protein (PQQ-dependent alcohol dehydrogenase system)
MPFSPGLAPKKASSPPEFGLLMPSSVPVLMTFSVGELHPKRTWHALVVSSALLLTIAPAFAEDAKPAGDAAKDKPEGGVEVLVPQTPAMTPQPIGYLKVVHEHPRPSSRLDVDPSDAGVAGAKMALDENNAGGKFTGDFYSLDVKTAASPEAALAALQKLYESGHHFIIVDARATTLIRLADWAKDKDILLFNVRATDVSLRQENCRANVLHTVPDRYMLADALAQFLIAKKWTNWLLVRGSTDADNAYVDAIKRAAARFGGNIVDEREYQDISGGKRDAMGVIPPPRAETASGTANAAPVDYQVIVVADEDQLWGPYVPWRGGVERIVPVVGTTGLTATTWSPGHEKWGATQANNHFQKDYDRFMLPIDYQAYVAARTIGEAVTRNHGQPFKVVADFITSDEFQLAPFKGIKQTYRKWDGQFRQPLLIATDKVPVSMSPQPGFPHASHPEIEVDTLGIDQPESKCKL